MHTYIHTYEQMHCIEHEHQLDQYFILERCLVLSHLFDAQQNTQAAACLLRERGLDATRRDIRGWTALHWAVCAFVLCVRVCIHSLVIQAACGDVATVALLGRDKRFNVLSTTHAGETPAHLAAREGSTAVLT